MSARAACRSSLWAGPAAALLLASCGAQEEPGGEGGSVAAAPVACRVSGAADFSAQCRLEWRAAGGEVRLLVLHHPDGGFRRLLVSGDGKRINAADGADLPQVTMREGTAEIVLGGDAYRIPAGKLASR